MPEGRARPSRRRRRQSALGVVRPHNSKQMQRICLESLSFYDRLRRVSVAREMAVFTTQEEVGLRGAKVAAYSVAPDLGIALDVTQSGDTPKGPKIAVKAGEGPCVKVFDSSQICSPKVVALLEKAADAAGVRYQREVLTAGGTDASAIQLTRGGIPAGTLSVACRYVHSACEAISVQDCEDSVKLLTALCMDAEI